MIILVTGGSGSGKSAWAERLACALEPGEKYYLATMRAEDSESLLRVARHRSLRAGKGFHTLECPDTLEGLELPEDSTVLLECLSNLVANRMFAVSKHDTQSLLRQLDELLCSCANAVIVTNEIFSDGVRYDPDTIAFLAVLGGLNQELAQRADLVFESVCGLPLVSKGVLPC